MARICLLITKPPHSDENAERMCGVSQRARESGMDVAIYLLGDGVLCAKAGQKGYVGDNIRAALENGVSIIACQQDLEARAISKDHVESGIEISDDFEGIFVEDVMERADRVISW
ncbi:MAG: DsrE family protein [Thermoplasmata archaeon]|nr:MAG: DsrE family protein [Thermoplasmata archaeon]